MFLLYKAMFSLRKAMHFFIYFNKMEMEDTTYGINFLVAIEFVIELQLSFN